MGARIGSVLVTCWLVIGAVAAFQEDYFTTGDWNERRDCARFGTTIATVVVGPLNYTGVDPRIGCDERANADRG